MSYEDEQDAHLRGKRTVDGTLTVYFYKPLSYWLSKPLGQGYDPCDPCDHWLAVLDNGESLARVAERLGLGVCLGVQPATDYDRPPEPPALDHVWYRGWEVGYDHDTAAWCQQGWRAYKGGCDLGAPEVMSATYQGCLDEIDEQEDG